MDKRLSSVDKYLWDNKQNIVDMLSDLVRIPSVTSDGKKGALYGDSCRDAILHTEGLFRGIGMETYTDPDSAYTLGTLNGDSKTLGIFCHADVVAAAEESWIVTKPFEPRLVDGFLYGRGSDDNKSGIVSAIWALKAMEHLGVMPKSTVTVYAGGNEECGMSDLEIYNSHHTSPDVSIVPDNEYPVCRGEKGILRFWARFRKPFENIISIEGGQSLNIVLGNISCEMKYSEALYERLKRICKDKDEYVLTAGESIRLTAKGRSSHAASPKDSLNALYVLICALENCEELGRDLEVLKDVKRLVADPFSETVGLDSSDPEFSKTTCTNGIVSTDNGRLNVSFDTRYGTQVDISEFIDGYTALLDSMGADIDVTEQDSGYVIPEDDPLIRAMTDVWRDVTGEEKAAILSYGGTYARHLKNAVSVGTCVPTAKPTVLPDGHGGAHQPDERIDADGLLKSIEILIHMILKADEILHA